MYIADSKRYDTMQYARCGKSGLKLPLVSLGLWHNFGYCDKYETMRDIVLTAFDHGVTHIDMANNYGPPPGAAEEHFGKLYKADLKPYRDELILSSKAGYGMWAGPYGEWGSRKYLMASLDQSLKRCGVDYFDIFYSHRPDPETPLEETMGALADMVRQGKALYVGISNYNPEQTARAVDILADMGVHCLIHQHSYSMLNRTSEDGLFSVLEEKGVGNIAFSPLAQGQLTDRYLSGIPADSRAARPEGFLKQDAVEQNIGKVRALKRIADEKGIAMAQLALLWVLRGGRVTSVLMGASSVAQLMQNLAIVNMPALTAADCEKIDKILTE